MNQSENDTLKDFQVAPELQSWQSDVAAEPEDFDLSAKAYAAYCVKAGGKTFDGKPLPAWAELGADRHACWVAAALAIKQELLALLAGGIGIYPPFASASPGKQTQNYPMANLLSKRVSTDDIGPDSP